MSDDQFYKKINGRYKPVGWSDRPAMYAEGIWLVIRHEGRDSKSCIQRIGELPSVYPYANLIRHADDISEIIQNYFETKHQNLIEHGRTAYGARELTDEILKTLGAKLANGGMINSSEIHQDSQILGDLKTLIDGEEQDGR